jgi:hypothetical protein
MNPNNNLFIKLYIMKETYFEKINENQYISSYFDKDAILYKSSQFDKAIDKLIEEFNIKEIINNLLDLPKIELLIYGGVIKDLINNDKINDIDIIILIDDINQLINFCFKKDLKFKLITFNNGNGNGNGNGQYIHYEIKSKNIKLFHGSIYKLDTRINNFSILPTCSKLYYSIKNRILIDIYQNSIKNIFNKKISLRGKYYTTGLFKQYCSTSIKNYEWSFIDIKYMIKNIYEDHLNTIYIYNLINYFTPLELQQIRNIIIADINKITLSNTKKNEYIRFFNKLFDEALSKKI